VVVQVQRGDRDLDIRILLRKPSFELVEAVGATGAKRQVAPLAANCRAIPAPRPELAPVMRIF